MLKSRINIMLHLIICLLKHICLFSNRYNNSPCLFLIVIYNKQEFKIDNFIREPSEDDFIENENIPKFHDDIKASYIGSRNGWPTSNLGTLIFKNIPINRIPLYNSHRNRTFVVLIWKYWKWLENRHVHSFKKQRNSDPLQGCSVKNCKFTGDDDVISSVDAVIVHVQQGVFPNTTKRNTKQRWVFLSDEPPTHSFSISPNPLLVSDIANIKNINKLNKSFITSIKFKLLLE